jgi:hypothetical protein
MAEATSQANQLLAARADWRCAACAQTGAANPISGFGCAFRDIQRSISGAADTNGRKAEEEVPTEIRVQEESSPEVQQTNASMASTVSDGEHIYLGRRWLASEQGEQWG